MQGFNMGRYVPPEHEGTTSANKLAGKHALGNRARKVAEGVLVVRFEMPYAIWCTTCPKETIIGQGVRFNAEKKKVGNYYSSAIYSFRMKHPACGGWIEIRTDPKNTAYVVTEGAKKRDTGDDRIHEGEIQIRTDEEKERLRNDAFAALEVAIGDRQEAAASKTRIEELLEAGEDWDDPYRANQKLRQAFRVGRKAREKNDAASENLKERMSLGMDLLEESEEDRQRATFVEFGEIGDRHADVAIQKIKSSGMFGSGSTNDARPARPARTALTGPQKNLLKAATARDNLRKEINSNTRAKFDPFLVSERIPSKMGALGHEHDPNPSVHSLASKTNGASTLLPGIKRKRSLVEDDRSSKANGSLVDYDSD